MVGCIDKKVPVKSELKIVLIVGSAPDALRVAKWDTSCFAHRVVINNAWQVCPSWDFLIYPEDFPDDRHPPADQLKGKKRITAEEFVPEQNRLGGFVYAGGTMSFTAGYWALGALKPDVIAYVGCDMVYASLPGQATHFYGQGVADPLRQDVTLQSLEAKSVRLMALAHQHGCALVNLSDQTSSRLRVPRMGLQALSNLSSNDHEDLLSGQSLDEHAIEAALSAEAQLGYMVPSGRYWEVASTFDKVKLRAIDDLWLSAALDGAPALA
jgi:hypothetical protein